MPTVAQIFAHTLREMGVRYVFGVPSGSMIDYIEALRKENDIDFILTSHEANAAIMAGICGRLTGIPGACFATFGPGATNLSSGVGAALLDRCPLIAFTDEMPDHLLNRTVQMNINHQLLFHPITKWTSRADNNNIRELILKGAGIAMDESPGSVHIGMPAGMGKLPAGDPARPVEYLRLEKELAHFARTDQFDEAMKVFDESKKPVMAVGWSAVRYGLKAKIIKLAEKYNIPVVLTPMAKGMINEEHKLYSGVLFHALSNIVAETCKEADLVLGVGYDPVEFNYEEWMYDVPLIHLDLNKADVDTKQITRVYNVQDPPGTSLNKMLEKKSSNKDWDTKTLVNRKEKMFKLLEPTDKGFGPGAVIKELRNQLPEQGILTVDVGAHLHLTGQMWRTPEPDKLLMTNGWSSMGFAMPAAIAAKLNYPELPVIALMGDGGFLMTAGELATARRLNLKIIFVVLNDNQLSLISIKQQKKNVDKHYGTALKDYSNEKVNHYFGVPVFCAKDLLEFQKAMEKALDCKGPIVIEVHIDSHEYDELVLKENKL